jgi:all-trans-retinol 13,14-reductase
MSGLSTAALLARKGKKVLVLEQHDTAGGCMHSFKQGGEWVCSGWHYVGRMSGPGRLVWDDITDSQKMTVCDAATVYDTNATVGRGLSKENFESEMRISKKAYRAMSANMDYYFAIKFLPAALAYCVWLFFSWSGKLAASLSNYGAWCRAATDATEFKDKDNEMWWTEQGDHGMPRDETIALVGCSIAHHYTAGVMHPEGGVPNTVTRICRVIRQRGGAVLVKARVTEIAVDGNAVRGVTVNGEFIKCSHVVVSGAHQLTKLVKQPPADIVDAVKAMGSGKSHGCVFLTFTGKTPADLALNVEGNVWLNEHFLSHKVSPTGTVVYLIWEMDYFARGAGYEERKTEAADVALKLFTNMFPSLATYDTIDSSTPATSEFYLNSDVGGSYGLRNSAVRYDNWRFSRALRPETTVTGLWLTGQDIMLGGITGAMMSGALTAQAMLYPGYWCLTGNVFLGLGKPSNNKDKVTAK